MSRGTWNGRGHAILHVIPTLISSNQIFTRKNTRLLHPQRFHQPAPHILKKRRINQVYMLLDKYILNFGH